MYSDLYTDCMFIGSCNTFLSNWKESISLRILNDFQKDRSKHFLNLIQLRDTFNSGVQMVRKSSNFFLHQLEFCDFPNEKFEFHTCQRLSKNLICIPTKTASIFVEKEHFGKSKIPKLQSRAKIKLKQACFWAPLDWRAKIPILFVIKPCFVTFLSGNSSYILSNDSLKKSEAYQ